MFAPCAACCHRPSAAEASEKQTEGGSASSSSSSPDGGAGEGGEDPGHLKEQQQQQCAHSGDEDASDVAVVSVEASADSRFVGLVVCRVRDCRARQEATRAGEARGQQAGGGGPCSAWRAPLDSAVCVLQALAGPPPCVAAVASIPLMPPVLLRQRGGRQSGTEEAGERGDGERCNASVIHVIIEVERICSGGNTLCGSKDQDA